MSNHAWGLLLGGFFTAIIYGISSVAGKIAANAGSTVGYHLLITGLITAILGFALILFNNEKLPALSALNWSSISALAFALGAGLVMISISHFGVPIAKLTPLYNMNTVVAVLLGAYLLKEWPQLDMIKLGLGTFFVILGGILAALS